MEERVTLWKTLLFKSMKEDQDLLHCMKDNGIYGSECIIDIF